MGPALDFVQYNRETTLKHVSESVEKLKSTLDKYKRSAYDKTSNPFKIWAVNTMYIIVQKKIYKYESRKDTVKNLRNIYKSLVKSYFIFVYFCL